MNTEVPLRRWYEWIEIKGTLGLRLSYRAVDYYNKHQMFAEISGPRQNKQSLLYYTITFSIHNYDVKTEIVLANDEVAIKYADHILQSHCYLKFDQRYKNIL